MHSIVWFWTTGIHDPAWVQAVASIALVLLTLVTLIYLRIYVRDTRTLARVSVEQIQLVKVDRETDSTVKLMASARCFSQVQANLALLRKSLDNGSFETTKPETFYPENWADVMTALRSLRLVTLLNSAIQLGNKLWNLDLAVKYYFDAVTSAEKVVCRQRVSEILTEATALAEGVYNNKYGFVANSEG